MLVYLMVHAGLAVLFSTLQALRVRAGYVGRQFPYEPFVIRPFWLYTLGVYWLGVAAFVLLPMAWTVR
jgi:cytochrome c oxidase subunit I+III